MRYKEVILPFLKAGCLKYLVQSLVIQKYTTKRPNNDKYDSK
jgi:hypothetical protein